MYSYVHYVVILDPVADIVIVPKVKENNNFRWKYFVTLSNTGSSTDNEQFYKKTFSEMYLKYCIYSTFNNFSQIEIVFQVLIMFL